MEFEFDVIAHQVDNVWHVAIGSLPAGYIMSPADARVLAAALLAKADEADAKNGEQ